MLNYYLRGSYLFVEIFFIIFTEIPLIFKYVQDTQKGNKNCYTYVAVSLVTN